MNFGLRVGYGPDLKAYSADEPLMIKMTSLKRVPLRPIEEAIIAAKQIAEQFGRQPWVCLSGGLDSEATALAFLQAGVNFKAVSMRFENDLNRHELKFAVDFCKKNNVAHELIDIPIIDFFESKKFTEYFHGFKAQTLEVCAQMYFLDQFTEPYVWSGEPLRLFRKGEGVILQAVSDFEQVFYRFGEARKRICVPNFHFFSSELAWSFFRNSLETPNDFFVDDHVEGYYIQKRNFYLQGGFNLLWHTDRIAKAHGFEQVKMYFDNKYSGTNLQDYNSVYRKPWKDMYPTLKQSLVDIPKTDSIARSLFQSN